VHIFSGEGVLSEDPAAGFFCAEDDPGGGVRQPEHYDTSKPAPLPFGLRKVWTADQVVMDEN
jgi:hypothetical protein